MKKTIKTSFSVHGFVASLMAFAPALMMRAGQFDFHSDIPSLICIILNLYMLLSLIFLQNTEAQKMDRNGRTISIASICYGIYFLFLVLFIIGKGGLWIVIAAHVFIYSFLILFSLDRHNWFSLSGAALSMIAVIARESSIVGGLL